MPRRAFRVPTGEQRDQMVVLYLGGRSLKAAGALAGGFCGAVVSRELARRGIDRRSPFLHCRKYDVNHDYFRVIDVEAKAYWLGFIVTDGCLLDADYTLSLTLGRRDIDHLGAFREAIGAGNPVRQDSYRRNGKEYLTCQLAIRSKPIWESLRSYGVTPRKSPTARPPEGIPPHLARHFWRGCVDGDGCLCQRSDGYWSVSFVGTEAMVGGFAGFVRDRLGIDRGSSPQGAGWLRQISYGGIDVPQQIARLLYDGATVSLDRKRTLADRLLAEVPRQRNRESRSFAWVTAEVLASLKAECRSWSGVARRLQVTVPNLMHIRRRLAGRKRVRKPYVRRPDVGTE